jgi:hypothetical protein
MKKIENITLQPFEQPSREIDKNFNKLISCSEINFYEYQNFIFKVSIYKQTGNGRKYVEMFDKSEKLLLNNLVAFQHFNWTEFYVLSIKCKLNLDKYRENEISFEKGYNRKGEEFRLEHLFKKLITIYELYMIEENLNSFESLN